MAGRGLLLGLYAVNRPVVVFSDGYQIFTENGVELLTTY
jgi:hypothetical protein